MLAWLPFVVASVSAALHSTNCRHIVGYGMAKKRRSEFFHFFQAGSADVFVLINLDVVGTVAEDTGGLILFKDDGVLVDIDFQGSRSDMPRVRRSSMGRTTRPSGSILRTIPVDFIAIRPFS
jgi:hypothetical protein